MSTAEAVSRQTNLEDLPQMLTPLELQAFFGLGRATVYRLIEAGDLPARRIGRRLFVPKKALLMEADVA